MPLSLKRRPNERDAIKVVHTALDAGLRLIDTANVYCLNDEDIGHNEALFNKALASWSGASSDVLVATKGGLSRPKGAWVRNAKPEFLRRSCEESLKALGVDCIRVYQLHAPDPEVPFLDTMGELKKLQDEGKVEHIGLSNVDVEEIKQAQTVVDIVSVQNRCHPLDTSAFKTGVVDYCATAGIAFIPYSPVGGWQQREALAKDSTLLKVASRHNASAQEVAIAWLAGCGEHMFPIPGASKVSSAKSIARAAQLVLSATDQQELNAAFLG